MSDMTNPSNLKENVSVAKAFHSVDGGNIHG
jgi:hypothetical protein